MTVFVPNGESQGLTATWLLHTADENGLDRRSIKTTRGGFNVPDELAACLSGEKAVPAPPVEVAQVEMPEVGSQFIPELPRVDVQFDAGGRIVLTDEAAEREITEGSVVIETDPAFADLISEVAAARESELNSADFSDEPVVDREVVRAWAKANGHEPAEKGALKKSVMEAYAAEHQG